MDAEAGGAQKTGSKGKSSSIMQLDRRDQFGTTPRRHRSLLLHVALLSFALCGSVNGFAFPEDAEGRSDCTCPTGLSVECYQVMARNSMDITTCFCSDSSPDAVPVPCLGADEKTLPQNASLGEDPAADCACNRIREPQCDITGQEVASNDCIRECLGYTKPEVNQWYCGEIPNQFFDDYFAEWDEADIPVNARQVGCRASCNMNDGAKETVCDVHGTELASSACLAECRGYAPEDFSAEYCADGYRDSVLCKCPLPSADEFVCTDKGMFVADSPCIAECIGYSLEEVTSENCDLPRDNCVCALLWAPLCDKKGTPMAGNKCEHSCVYGDEAGQTFSEDLCQQSLRDNAACKCEGPEEPMCDQHGTVVAPNRCVAECAGYTAAAPCLTGFTAPAETDPEPGAEGGDATGDKGVNQNIGIRQPVAGGEEDNGAGVEQQETEGSDQQPDEGDIFQPDTGGAPLDKPESGPRVVSEPDSHARQNQALLAQGLVAALCLLCMLAV
mmetsp:Transcript_39235/g.111075  ORF Transcript_39235/g.111075 Transcript_39235/m.111075 type:complete len:501 (+) Transcript_39235:210-1712(+)